MKIVDMFIYGFGRFENKHIHFSKEGVQVIYGDNEAGKSTIMAFIEYMLYGFPKRSEKRLRFEPKTTQAYGGKLRVYTIKHGVITIERKGGSSGNLTLHQEDSTVEDESFLKDLLAEVNHTTFRDIFSFNLDGLQKVSEITSEKLGEYLFNAGLTGAQQLNEVRTLLENKQNQLFKPNGKNPILNQKLFQLLELDSNVVEWREKLDNFNKLKIQLNQKRIELRLKEAFKEKVERERTDLLQLQSLAPLLKQQRSYQYQLENLPSAKPFPENGLERFQKWQERKLEIQTDWDHFNELIQLNRRADDQLKPDKRIVDCSEEIVKLERAYRLYQVQHSTLQKNEERVEHLEKEMDSERKLLGLQWSDEQIAAVDTNLVNKQQLTTKLKELESLTADQKRLDTELNQSRHKLEVNEEKIAKIQKDCLPDKTKQAYEGMLRESSDIETNSLKKQMDTLTPIKSTIALVVVFTLTGVILGGFWIANGELLQGTIIAICLIGAGIVVHRNKTQNRHVEQQVKELKHQLNEKQRLNQSMGELNRLEKILAQQQQYDFQLDHLKTLAEELEREYQGIVQRYDCWEFQYHKAVNSLQTWKKQYKIDKDVPNGMLLEFFERIHHLKQRLAAKKNLQKESAPLKNELELYEQSVQQLIKYTGIPYNGMESSLLELTNALQKEKEKQDKKIQLQKEHSELTKQLSAVQKKLNQYNEEINKLFKIAEVADEEAFWSKGKVNEKYRSLSNQLRAVNDQLQTMAQEDKINHFKKKLHKLPDTENNLNELEEKLNDIFNAIEQGRNECAELQVNIQHLEQDGTYSNQLHALQAAQNEFSELAKRWAIYRTADYVLKKAKHNYQKRRQPNVIKRAQGYLSQLTDGVYLRILAPEGESSLLIMRKDTVVFNPEELSRATIEQLYLALRLALAEEYENSSAFPILLDDILVNFDQYRRQHAVQLIKQIAQHRQVIYFTCHPATAEKLGGHSQPLTEPKTMAYAKTLQEDEHT